MPNRNFEATDSFYDTIGEVLFLKDKAIEASHNDQDNIRMLYLKLSVVNSVIKFQVFIESILKEYKYKVTQMSVRNRELPIHLRLNWLKIALEDKKLLSCLNDPTTYSETKLTEVRQLLYSKYSISHDNRSMTSNLEFNIKFPMGKQGLKQLKKLFKQINGEDVFVNFSSDENRINEILNMRHNIVHDDTNPTTLSEAKIVEYVDFFKGLVEEIDEYCYQFCE